MFTGEELVRAKKELNLKREADYSNALNGNNSIIVGKETVDEVEVDKVVTVCGGTERLVSLQVAYDTQFVDGTGTILSVKQADGSLVDCTQAECDELFKLMRAKGKEYFKKMKLLKLKLMQLQRTVFLRIFGILFGNRAIFIL